MGRSPTRVPRGACTSGKKTDPRSNLIFWAVREQRADALGINLVGRQRMLIQQMTLQTLGVQIGLYQDAAANFQTVLKIEADNPAAHKSLRDAYFIAEKYQ